MDMKSKPDDRSDNVKKILRSIGNTVKNMELADDMADITGDNKAKKDLRDKNARRRAALDSMRGEIKDEADFQNRH
jgi:small acid-soluble spore protein (thioredoxin-like protein)